MKKLSQAERLRQLLADGEPHSTPEIQQVVYGGAHLGTARIASRVTDLRSRGDEIASWQDKERSTVWWYQMQVKRKPVIRVVMTPNGPVAKYVDPANAEEEEAMPA